MKREAGDVEHLRSVGTEQEPGARLVKRLDELAAHRDEPGGSGRVVIRLGAKPGARLLPAGEHLARDVTHLLPGDQLGFGQIGQQHMVHEALGRDVPHPRPSGEARHLRDLALIHPIAEIVAEEAPSPLRRREPVAHQQRHVAVEMVDGDLPDVERSAQADRVGNMPAEPNPVLPRRGGDGVVAGAVEAGMDLQEIVAGRLLLGDHPSPVLGRRHRIAVERRPRRVEAGADQLAALELRAKLEMDAARPSMPRAKVIPLAA